MRKKTVERRQAIVAVAAEIFLEFGYSRASMSMISARLGGSKSTIYSYFSTKEELFGAVISETIVDRSVECAEHLLQSDQEPTRALLDFAEEFLALFTTDSSVAAMRAGISGSFELQSLTSIYHENAKRTWVLVARFLERLQQQELLREVDLEVMVAHLKGLIEAGVFEPLLAGDTPWLDPKHSAGPAIDAFLRAYGTPLLEEQASRKELAG